MIFVGPLIGKGAILVGLNHKMFHGISEVVVLESFGLFDKSAAKSAKRSPARGCCWADAIASTRPSAIRRSPRASPI